MSVVPRIKLCGLRGTDDAHAAVQAGADQVGIVLVPGTRRYVPPPTATAMVHAVRDAATALGRFTPEVVGIVGRMPLAVVATIPSKIGLDAVQLVGNDEECLPLLDVLDGTPVIRTISVSAASDLDAVRASIHAWRAHGARIVLDAAIEGELGGTGHRIDVDVVRALDDGEPFGLAGGLTPDNVAEAIRQLAPAVVDVSSGIESHAGHKDAELMRAFVAAARSAHIDDHVDGLLAPTDTTTTEHQR